MSQQNKLVGDRVRRTRLALRLNGPQFAELIGTDKGTLKKIEDGARSFTLPMALKLRKKRQITLDWIYCADPARLPLDVSKDLEMTEVA